MVAKVVLMQFGHDPRAVEDYPWRDVVQFIEYTFGGE